MGVVAAAGASVAQVGREAAAMGAAVSGVAMGAAVSGVVVTATEETVMEAAMGHRRLCSKSRARRT